jgi:hypothetical protein
MHVCDFLATCMSARPGLLSSSKLRLSFVRDSEVFPGSLLVVLVAWPQASLGEGGHWTDG